MIFCDWLMTLFCGFFNCKDLQNQILDNFFLDGWPAIYRISLTILRKLEPELITLDDVGQIAKRF
jgi:hypothetical protein